MRCQAEHDPISLAKTIASLDHLCGGRVNLGIGFGWNTDELTDHGVPSSRRRTAVREYLEAMRALWSLDEASYAGEFVNFGPSWAWPNPPPTRDRLRDSRPGRRRRAERTFGWIARCADGWITTPQDTGIEQRIGQLRGSGRTPAGTACRRSARWPAGLTRSNWQAGKKPA